MLITLLGAGGAFVDYRNEYCTSALVETGSSKYLIDCGPTTMQALRELSDQRGYDVLGSIDGVMITHLHPDHVADLGTLAFFLYYLKGKKLSVYAHPRIALAVSGLLTHTMGRGWDRDGFVVDTDEEFVKMRVYEEVSLPGLGVVFEKVPHCPTEAAYGVLLYQPPEAGEKPTYVWWSGDTTSCSHLHLREPYLIFHDCSPGPKYPNTVHTHLEDLVVLPSETQEKIVLVHHNGDHEGIQKALGDCNSPMKVGQRFQSFQVEAGGD
jgi:hypothetical protein